MNQYLRSLLNYAFRNVVSYFALRASTCKTELFHKAFNAFVVSSWAITLKSDQFDNGLLLVTLEKRITDNLHLMCFVLARIKNLV